MTKVQMLGGAALMWPWFMAYQSWMGPIPSAVGFWVSFAVWIALTRSKA